MTFDRSAFRLPVIIASFVGASLLSNTSMAQESVETLANKLPPGANVIMLIDVQKIQMSAIASTDEWKESVRDHYGTGLGKVLRQSRLAAVAASVNRRWAEPVWRAAILVEGEESQFPNFKKTFSGDIDRQLGFEFIELDNDSYVFSPTQGQIAVFTPTERQYFSRWLQHLGKPSDWLANNHLNLAVDRFKSADTQVAIGADLRFSYSPVRVLDEVQDSELLTKHDVTPKDFAKLVSSIEGFTISSKFTDTIDSVVELTFSEDVSSLKLVARELAFDFLEDAGIRIPEMTNWQVNVNGGTVKIAGPLSIDGFRLMVSELDLVDEMPVWASQGSGDFSPKTVTRDYFKTVNRLMEDLRNRRSDSVNFGSNAAWMERYAKRIQRLPTQFVDEEVVDFADKAIVLLIESSTELRNTAEKNKTDSASIRQSRSRSGSRSGSRSRSASRGNLRDEFGVVTASRGRNPRFSRFNQASGGTGKYQQQFSARQNAEKVWTDINLKLEEFSKASLRLQRLLEKRYDLDY